MAEFFKLLDFVFKHILISVPHFHKDKFIVCIMNYFGHVLYPYTGGKNPITQTSLTLRGGGVCTALLLCTTVQQMTLTLYSYGPSLLDGSFH
jgi:hypothetical protein